MAGEIKINDVSIATESGGTVTIAPNNVTFAANHAGIKAALNASGSASVYACRAWIRFNGTGTVSILGSGNVSSLTDLGTGNYRVNFTNAMPDANFSTVTSSVAGGGYGDKGPYTYGESTGSVIVFTYNSSGALVDNNNVKAAILR